MSQVLIVPATAGSATGTGKYRVNSAKNQVSLVPTLRSQFGHEKKL
jgi:hypothetical protein